MIKVETCGGKEYRATEYEANRERWLNGEELSWSDYFNLRDYAAATNDPIQRVLRTSPKTPVEKLRATAA